MNKAKDPADLWRSWVSKMEREIDSMSQKLMKTDEFARTTHTLNDIRMSLREAVGGVSTKNLELFNMPSKEDVTGLGDRLAGIERRLTMIERMLTTLAEQKSGEGKTARSGPPRTKMPPKKAAKKAAKKASTKKKPAKDAS
ncbi:MAG: hypothetical protein EP347_04020 [Alphaproteobacteria bacterium]|nr:MAG: hypothetical protein EP347_04020 [Alphaproteobacteria bacterium]